VSSLLDKRLVFVTGKGGVGKTTLAAALGLAAARRGKRVVLCEVAEQDRLPQLVPDIDTVSVDPERAKLEWLRYQLKSRTLAGALGGSALFGYLTAAAPGLTELVTIGKVWDLAQIEPRTGGPAYDLAIVDAPATGHGLAMLSAPSTYASIARVGPVGRHAERIDSFLRDPARTGVLTVALPEEMPVNETVEFERALKRDLDMSVDAIVVNAVHPLRFRPEELERLERASSRLDRARPHSDRDRGLEPTGHTPVAQAALSSALSGHKRAKGEHAQVRRLRRSVSAPVVTLPRIFEPELGREHVERLSHELERKL
jgi:anion-transporting  ArsA/GET3 family ATPase